jgi:von Willebrand factor A domain-containing protein 8
VCRWFRKEGTNDGTFEVMRHILINEAEALRALHCKAARRCLSGFSNDPKGRSSVRIGHVEKEISDRIGNDAHLIPSGYLGRLQHSSESMQHLQWMMAKDNLGQDMLLVGPPGAGAILRRRLALAYAELTQRPVEFLTLSGDTTESDLKQRRELLPSTTGISYHAKGLNMRFVDQAPVRAALNGRLLILDGLHTAERNVLPTLNNLLENREMHLEDGRLLVSAHRYQLLSGEMSTSSFLVPTHDEFRVVALSVPSPPYQGIGLDPPVRSRFQIRRIDVPPSDFMFESIAAEIAMDDAIAKDVVLFASAIETAAKESLTRAAERIWHFPVTAANSICRLMLAFPDEPRHSIFSRAYPFGSQEKRLASVMSRRHAASRQSFFRTCDELNIENPSKTPAYDVASVAPVDGDPFHVKVEFKPLRSLSLLNFQNGTIEVTVPSGGGRDNPLTSHGFVRTDGSKAVLSAMIQEHFAGRDILLVGPKGEGKSAIATEFAASLGYSTHMFSLYKEMTGHDLLMRRISDSVTGETGWAESPLLIAARTGQICVLDGIEKLTRDTLGTLQRLLTDREVALPDGTILIQSICASGDAGVIHPSFRTIALASISDSSPTPWMAEIPSMFSTIALPAPTRGCLKEILLPVNTYCISDFDKILDFSERLTQDLATDCGVSPLSTRSLLRVVKRDQVGISAYEALCSALLADLLPPSQRATLETLLKSSGIRPELPARHSQTSSAVEVMIETDRVSIGGLTIARKVSNKPELVPSPYFFDIPAHLHLIRTLLGEWSVGERSFLMLGNQGTGKNKICDRVCELANFEREYIQLHRDSTIGQLTLSPSLDDGKIVWKDSPLVRAVTEGRALVIDEADKAPLEVVSVLKSLVEDGELLLADGRRILRNNSKSDRGKRYSHCYGCLTFPVKTNGCFDSRYY